jgi:hypothetical protein
MDKASVYIKNLIALAISFLITAWLGRETHSILVIPFGFLVLSFLYFKITGKKPDLLYGIPASDKFINNKGGFWLLFKWILTFFGLIYDIVIWTITGIYVLFQIFIDILLLIKSIIFWIIHAILWFLKLFVPPIVFVYKMFLHYFIHWIWWIYKLTFRNIAYSVNKNFYFTALYGAVLSIFLVLLFYGVGILVGIPQIVFVGCVFAILPVVWSYGEISAIRHEQRLNSSFSDVKARFSSGFDAVKAVLFYLVILLFGLLAEIVLNMMGWIPNVGFSLLGISWNINSIISLLLIFIFVILIFAEMMIPPHVVHHKDYENDSDNIFKLLGVIGSKFLKYILSLIPASFFSFVIVLIPAMVVGLSVLLSLNVKENVLDARLIGLKSKIYTLEGVEKFKAELRADRLVYYKNYPMNYLDDYNIIKSRIEDKNSLKDNISSAKFEFGQVEKMYNEDITSLENEINSLEGISTEEALRRKSAAESSLKNKKADFSSWKVDRELDIAKMELKLRDEKGMIAQLPIVYLFTIIWLSLFGGLILAVIMAYMGNVYYELYGFKEDERPTYFRQVSSELNNKDKNQPLLGFTLFVLIGFVIWLVLSNGIL